MTTNQIERDVASAASCIVLLGWQGVLAQLTSALDKGEASRADLAALNALLQVADAQGEALYRTVGEPAAPVASYEAFFRSIEGAWDKLDEAMRLPTQQTSRQHLPSSKASTDSTSRPEANHYQPPRPRKTAKMRCALCDHRDQFPQTGRTRDTNRKVFRCPECKYDQARDLFGHGQYLFPGTAALDISPETSPTKLLWERALVEQGVIGIDDATPPR